MFLWLMVSSRSHRPAKFICYRLISTIAFALRTLYYIPTLIL